MPAGLGDRGGHSKQWTSGWRRAGHDMELPRCAVAHRGPSVVPRRAWGPVSPPLPGQGGGARAWLAEMAGDGGDSKHHVPAMYSRPPRPPHLTRQGPAAAAAAVAATTETPTTLPGWAGDRMLPCCPAGRGGEPGLVWQGWAHFRLDGDGRDRTVRQSVSQSVCFGRAAQLVTPLLLHGHSASPAAPAAPAGGREHEYQQQGHAPLRPATQTAHSRTLSTYPVWCSVPCVVQSTSLTGVPTSHRLPPRPPSCPSRLLLLLLLLETSTPTGQSPMCSIRWHPSGDRLGKEEKRGLQLQLHGVTGSVSQQARLVVVARAGEAMGPTLMGAESMGLGAKRVGQTVDQALGRR